MRTPLAMPQNSLGAYHTSKSAKLMLRRPHRKSRNGCINCKRRKVKCDETKPVCTNCVRFGIPCDFAPSSSGSRNPPEESLLPTAQPLGQTMTPRRRGPGRPRKNWGSFPTQAQRIAEKVEQSSSVTESSTPTPDLSACGLNVSDAELLFQFMTATAETLAAQDSVGSSAGTFWSHNALQIGMSYHFVLHLSYSLAAYHLAHLDDAHDSRDRYAGLAERHASLGLSELNKELSDLSETNCGALYLSAILVCYCSFAAGPMSSTDLLLCDVEESAPERWLPLIHGVRLIRQTVDPATLFTGLMAPLGPSEGASDEFSDEEKLPAHVRYGFPWVDWIKPLESLRALIISNESPDTIMYMRSFDGLWNLYEASYGGVGGTHVNTSSKFFVFGWLYRTQDSFIAALRRKEPLSLLILAYYAPLLQTMKQCWFLDGWTEHLLRTIREVIDPALSNWMQWPLEIAKME